MKAQRQQQMIWAIALNGAFFVAMLLADGFRSAHAPPAFVASVSAILAVSLGVMVALELVIQRLERRRR